MADKDEDRDKGGQEQGSAPAVTGGLESETGPAGAGGGRESVSVSGADLDVDEGPREASGSALEAEAYDAGAAESGGTGGVNAGGAG